jgi:hypothetical protein
MVRVFYVFFYNFAANIACRTTKKAAHPQRRQLFLALGIQLLNNSYNGI